MEKYKEIVQSLGLDKFLKEDFDSIYERLADFSSQVVPENPLRMTDKAKEGLVTLASSATQVGGSF